MSYLIMKDRVDYECNFFPTHILDKDCKPIQVCVGAMPEGIMQFNAAKQEYELVIGIYVSEKHYHQIDHAKPYVLVHDPDINETEVAEALAYLEHDCSMTIDESDRTKLVRPHVHLYKPIEHEESKSVVGDI